METNFWLDVFSSLISGTIIAVVFGIVFHFLFERWINELERKENRIESKILDATRGLELIDAIKSNSESYKNNVDKWIAAINIGAAKGDYVSPIFFSMKYRDLM
ncbi:MAG: hypothetical protein JW987_11275 [Anaerolineaceae bacterium]|nr:hypothetical protein [Anaerolineaceae bacterium]